MHITLYKQGKIPIPPIEYGGAERIIFWLGKALVKLGHRVTLIANIHSHIPGVELRSLPNGQKDSRAWMQLIPETTDIVHFHAEPQQSCEKPFVFTVHGNGHPGQKFQENAIFVSQRNAANHGSRHFVYNGLDPDDFECSDIREKYAVFLAKARWRVKNFQGAVQVARKAGIELRVIGSRNWPLNLHKLLPSIGGVRYLGSLPENEKRKIISKARCLIFPVCWEEPGALALLEALVSGCYVVGTPYGCLPEVVTPDVGVLSAKMEKLAEAVNNPQQFSPQKCRERILRGSFTHLDMAKNYLKFYERVLARGSLLEEGETAPATRPGFVAKQLLPWEN